MFEIDILSDKAPAPVDDQAITQTVQSVLEGEGYAEAVIGIVVVDDPAIRQFNSRYLDHDWETDVISFPLSNTPERVEGEIIVSLDTAARMAEEIEDWTTENELLLYVVHGILHLVGYDDSNDAQRSAMRERERHYLALRGLQPSYEED